MSDSLTRLAWALPLVLVIGLVAVLALRRFSPATVRSQSMGGRLHVNQTVTLSERLQVHLLQIDGADWLVIDGSATATAMPVQQRSESPSWGRSGARRRLF